MPGTIQLIQIVYGPLILPPATELPPVEVKRINAKPIEVNGKQGLRPTMGEAPTLTDPKALARLAYQAFAGKPLTMRSGDKKRYDSYMTQVRAYDALIPQARTRYGLETIAPNHHIYLQYFDEIEVRMFIRGDLFDVGVFGTHGDAKLSGRATLLLRTASVGITVPTFDEMKAVVVALPRGGFVCVPGNFLRRRRLVSDRPQLAWTVS